MRLWVGLTSLDVRGRAAEEGAGGVSQAGAARAGTGGDRQEPRPTRSRHRPELAAPLATQQPPRLALLQHGKPDSFCLPLKPKEKATAYFPPGSIFDFYVDVAGKINRGREFRREDRREKP